MRDVLDRKTVDPFKETEMTVYQVNFKYIHPTNRNIRSGATAIEAENSNDARKKAVVELKKEWDHFEITSVKEWAGANK